MQHALIPARLFLAALVAFALSAPMMADATPRPEAQSIAPGIWMIPGGILPGRQPDGNTVIFDAPDGLIVMDTGRHKWHRDAILEFAKHRGKRIVGIVNSHWHLDHVSGNPDLRAAYPGLTVYASNAISDALKGFLPKSAADARPYLESGKLPPDTAEDVRNDMATIANGKALLPDVVIDRSAMRVIAGKPLMVNLAANAATAGDVWLFDPVTKVVAAGDLVTLPAAFLDTACPAGWRKALDDIEKTPFTVVLPGHGAPMTRAQFGTYREAFDSLVDCSASAREASACATDWTNSVQGLLGKGPPDPKQAQEMTAYYVKDVLRAHGGKSAECRI